MAVIWTPRTRLESIHWSRLAAQAAEPGTLVPPDPQNPHIACTYHVLAAGRVVHVRALTLHGPAADPGQALPPEHIDAVHALRALVRSRISDLEGF